MRKLLLLLFIGVLAFGQSSLTVFSLPDVTMTGSRVQLSSSTTLIARQCQLVAPSANNAAGIRWGDSTTTTSRGALIAPGAGQFIPPTPASAPQAGTATFAVSSIYLIGTSSDKITATCWK